MAYTLEQLAAIAKEARDVKIIFVAAIAMLVYDTVLNLADEVKLIWFQRWSVGKMLYLTTRYSAIFDGGVLLYYLFYEGTVDTCSTSYKIVFWSFMVGIILAEVVLILRTYAIWEQNHYILAYLSTLQVLFIALSAVYNKRAVDSITFVPSPFPEVIPCLPVVGNGKMSVAYSCVMAAELNVLVLSLYKGLSQWRRDSTRLVHTLYRDGVAYFAILFTISVANVIILGKLFNSPYYQILTEVQRALHAILASHLIMNVRKVANSSSEYIYDSNANPTRGTKGGYTESLNFSSGMTSGSRTEHFEFDDLKSKSSRY